MLKSDFFNNNLRKERENKNFSQIEMAKLVKIPVSTYRNYENTTRQPDFETLIKIAEVLNVSVDRLLGNTSKAGLKSEILSKISTFDKEMLKELDLFIDFIIHKTIRYKG